MSTRSFRIGCTFAVVMNLVWLPAALAENELLKELEQELKSGKLDELFKELPPLVIIPNEEPGASEKSMGDWLADRLLGQEQKTGGVTFKRLSNKEFLDATPDKKVTELRSDAEFGAWAEKGEAEGTEDLRKIASEGKQAIWAYARSQGKWYNVGIQDSYMREPGFNQVLFPKLMGKHKNLEIYVVRPIEAGQELIHIDVKNKQKIPQAKARGNSEKFAREIQGRKRSMVQAMIPSEEDYCRVVSLSRTYPDSRFARALPSVARDNLIERNLPYGYRMNDIKNAQMRRHSVTVCNQAGMVSMWITDSGKEAYRDDPALLSAAEDAAAYVSEATKKVKNFQSQQNNPDGKVFVKARPFAEQMKATGEISIQGNGKVAHLFKPWPNLSEKDAKGLTPKVEVEIHDISGDTESTPFEYFTPESLQDELPETKEI